MKNQNGASLVVALIFLTIITLASVYSIEGSTIQSKMIANSLFSSLTYQECRNEQEANIRFFNSGSNVETLIDLADTKDSDGNHPVMAFGLNEDNLPFTTQYTLHPAKSEITHVWTYVGDGTSAGSGQEVGEDAPTAQEKFENTCQSSFRFSKNNQTMGVNVTRLKQKGSFADSNKTGSISGSI